MKKLLFIPLSLVTVFVSAQTLNRKVVLSQGQQIERVADVKMNFSMDMMGQSIDMNMSNGTTSLVEVKTASAKENALTSTVKRILMTLNGMGQEMTYDSDKKEDADSEIGKKMGEMVGKTTNLKVDGKGTITASDDTTSVLANSANGFMSMAGNIANAGNKVGNVYDLVANLPEKAIKAGDTWADSTASGQNKSATNYTVLEVKGGEATIGMDGTIAQSGETETNGMTVHLNLSGKSKGQYIMDVATGLVKKRTVAMDATGTMDVMGQSVPFTMKMNMTEDVAKK
jgi:sporulation protein YlmC with PRC-barrel domain